MYKDGVPGGKGCLNSLLTFIFILSLIAFIGTAILYLLASIMIALWPVFYIILCIGLVGIPLLMDWPIEVNPGPFLDALTPVLIGTLIIFVAAFTLRFVIDWLYVLNQSRKLGQDPEENKHFIAVAKVVRKLKIVDLIVFALRIIVIVLAIIITKSIGFDSDDTMLETVGTIALILFLALPILNRIFARVQFKKINADVQAIIGRRNTIELV